MALRLGSWNPNRRGLLMGMIWTAYWLVEKKKAKKEIK